MTAAEIRAAIAADPALQALAARGATQAIADTLSVGRTRIVTGQTITTRGAAARFPSIGGLPGPLAFEAAMLALETFASAQADSSDLATKLLARGVSRQLQGFQALGLDFGEPALRTMVDGLVPAVLTQAQADGFKALALVPDTVTHTDVGAALQGA